MSTLIIECSDMAPSSRLGSSLQDHGHRLDVRRMHRGDHLDTDPGRFDAVLCFGGPQSANDDSLPWIENVIECLSRAHASGVPVLGICLGSQLLARALGGSVGPMPDGPRVGWAETELTPIGREDPLQRGLPWRMMNFHWNRECVIDLPDEAQVQATGPSSEIQCWSLGTRTYGIQNHPEINRGQVDDWAADDMELLDQLGLTARELEEETDERFDEFTRLTDRLHESICLLLMPLDRRTQVVAQLP